MMMSQCVSVQCFQKLMSPVSAFIVLELFKKKKKNTFSERNVNEHQRRGSSLAAQRGSTGSCLTSGTTPERVFLMVLLD